MNWSFQVLLPAAGEGALTHTLAATAGDFVTSGQAANGTISRRLVAGNGSFALSAFALLRRGFVLSAIRGIIAASGQSAVVTKGRRVLAECGSIAASGQESGIGVLRYLFTTVGSLAASGRSASIRVVAGVLVAAAGGIGFGGKAAALGLARRISSGSALFTASLSPAVERAARHTAAAPAILWSNGQPCALASARRLVAARGAFAAFGQATGGGTTYPPGPARTLGVGISLTL